jgi:hypothetical protein
LHTVRKGTLSYKARSIDLILSQNAELRLSVAISRDLERQELHNLLRVHLIQAPLDQLKCSLCCLGVAIWNPTFPLVVNVLL